jgi:hypothetical protein
MVKSNKTCGKAKKALKGGDMTIGWAKGTENGPPTISYRGDDAERHSRQEVIDTIKLIVKEGGVFSKGVGASTSALVSALALRLGVPTFIAAGLAASVGAGTVAGIHKLTGAGSANKVLKSKVSNPNTGALLGLNPINGPNRISANKTLKGGYDSHQGGTFVPRGFMPELNESLQVGKSQKTPHMKGGMLTGFPNSGISGGINFNPSAIIVSK